MLDVRIGKVASEWVVVVVGEVAAVVAVGMTGPEPCPLALIFSNSVQR